LKEIDNLREKIKAEATIKAIVENDYKILEKENDKKIK
jgi:hypothetical protein